VHFPEDVR